jgi:histidinol-phosphate aminotransferase
VSGTVEQDQSMEQEKGPLNIKAMDPAATVDLCERSPSYVRQIAPYQPGKPISELAREMGLVERDIVKLASNENPLGPSPRALGAISSALDELSRYPDGNQYELKVALSRRYGWPTEGIVVGNGSNDLLEMAAAAFLAPGRACVFSQHAFAVYPLATEARGARSIVTPARNYGHDLEAMARAVTPDTRLVFIANPNNPTGTLAPYGELEQFMRGVPDDVAVVLDEAYNEYLPQEVRFDTVAWLARFPNLAIVRTFSKIYGLAGLRVGFALMQPALADLLNRVRQPFNVNNLALVAAEAALSDLAFVERSCELNRRGMAQLAAGFSALGLSYIPSYANFISVELPRRDGAPRAAAVYHALLRRGVIVRPVGGYGMPNHLRVTIGLPEENNKLLRALGDSLG